MYNNETERKDGEAREEGGQRANKRNQEGVRGGDRGRVFHVSPEFERPSFYVSIVIFCLFSFHLPHLSSHDEDITLSGQHAARKSVHQQCVCVCEKES